MNDTTSSTLHKATKHTPGPWTAKRTAVYDAVYGPNEELISFVGFEHGINSSEITPANVRLIAAAPELLEAAQLAANILFLLWPEVEQLGLNAKNVPEILGRAIAKAEGK